MMYNPILGPF